METYTMKEIEQKFGYSPSWIRKMEAKGLIEIESPKGSGRRARKYTENEVSNFLWLFYLRQAGYSLDQLGDYIEKIKRLKKLISKYRGDKVRELHVTPVLLFDIKDLFAGNLAEIEWNKIPENEWTEIKDLLIWFRADAMALVKLIKNREKDLEFTLKSMAIAKKRVNENFIPNLNQFIGRLFAGKGEK